MNRNEHLEIIKTKKFDVLVIGGGITGCGIALDAATRGLSVALIDMGDFASGTSSKSTKLIHGGLRYLKNMDFKLVMEVGKERSIVHRNAYHLVHPEKMLLPIVQKGNYGKWMTNLGLRVYDWLADVPDSDKMKMLSKEQTLKLEPLLKSKKLLAGAIYSEYRTDDARLVISVAKTASVKGVKLANYVKVNEFKYTNDKVSGAFVEDVLTEDKFEINADQVVNATGPWVDRLRKLNKSKSNTKLFLTKGIHIVVKRSKLPIQQTLYFDNIDQRMIFCIPRYNKVYIGTTDTKYTNTDLNSQAEVHDIEYLIAACNKVFKDTKLEPSDVIANWSGLRPLIHQEGKSESELSRKDEIFVSKSGLISIAGGKLTGYRKMAKRVVDIVVKDNFTPCTTKNLVLSGGDFTKYNEVNRLINNLTEIYKDHETEMAVRKLIHRHGKNGIKILSHRLKNQCTLVESELRYTIKAEMCMTAMDFFDRRTGMVYFQPKNVLKRLDLVIEILTEEYGWSQAKISSEKKKITDKIEETKRCFDNQQ